MPTQRDAIKAPRPGVVSPVRNGTDCGRTGQRMRSGSPSGDHSEHCSDRSGPRSNGSLAKFSYGQARQFRAHSPREGCSGHVLRVEMNAAAEPARVGDGRDTEPDVGSEHGYRPDRDNRGTREAKGVRLARHISDEPGDKMLSPTDTVHDACADRAAHELERSLLPGQGFLLPGLPRNAPDTNVGFDFPEGKPYEHDPDLIPRCPTALQRDRHRDG